MCLGILPVHILLARSRRVNHYHHWTFYLRIQTLAVSQPCGLARLHTSLPGLGISGQCLPSFSYSFLLLWVSAGRCREPAKFVKQRNGIENFRGRDQGQCQAGHILAGQKKEAKSWPLWGVGRWYSPLTFVNMSWFTNPPEHGGVLKDTDSQGHWIRPSAICIFTNFPQMVPKIRWVWKLPLYHTHWILELILSLHYFILISPLSMGLAGGSLFYLSEEELRCREWKWLPI